MSLKHFLYIRLITKTAKMPFQPERGKGNKLTVDGERWTVLHTRVINIQVNKIIRKVSTVVTKPIIKIV
jgi:hypothetical protein